MPLLQLNTSLSRVYLSQTITHCFAPCALPCMYVLRVQGAKNQLLQYSKYSTSKEAYRKIAFVGQHKAALQLKYIPSVGGGRLTQASKWWTHRLSVHAGPAAHVLTTPVPVQLTVCLYPQYYHNTRFFSPWRRDCQFVETRGWLFTTPEHRLPSSYFYTQRLLLYSKVFTCCRLVCYCEGSDWEIRRCYAG